MGKIYDDWEKLVEVVVRREKLREIAMCQSIDSSSISDGSSRFDISSTCLFHEQLLPAYDVQTPQSPETNATGLNCGYPGMSFFLMAGSTNLTISCDESSETRKGLRDPAFQNVAVDFETVKIESVSWFDIRGKMKTFMLSRMTIYGAYLVFKYNGDMFKGFQSAKAIIRFDKYESLNSNAEKRREVLNIGRTREDGWIEVEIGSFYIEQHDYDENVEARLIVNENVGNNVIIVGGIEFRPLTGVKQV